MNRRNFLRNSIGALLFGSLSSNKVLANVVDLIPDNSPKILLYLIQLTTGEYKIKATKWVDLPKKRLTEKNIIKESFKALEIVSLNEVVQKRKELWKKYKCSGKMGHLVNMGIPFDEEMKNEYIQIGKKHKGKIVSESTLKKMSEVNIGKKHSNETKEICRQKSLGLNLGRKHSEIAKIKLSNFRKGKKLSDEIKNKMSQSQKKRKNHFNEEAIKNRKIKTSRPILYYKLPEMILIGEYESIISASIDLNRDRYGITKICNGKIKNPRNFTFKYKE